MKTQKENNNFINDNNISSEIIIFLKQVKSNELIEIAANLFLESGLLR